MRVKQVTEKVSYNIYDDPKMDSVVAVERVFKGQVKVHVLIRRDGSEGRVVSELTKSSESWKETTQKYGLIVEAGKS